MCDGHRDLYQNIEVLQRQVKALLASHEIEEEYRTEGGRSPSGGREE